MEPSLHWNLRKHGYDVSLRDSTTLVDQVRALQDGALSRHWNLRMHGYDVSLRDSTTWVDQVRALHDGALSWHWNLRMHGYDVSLGALLFFSPFLAQV